MLQILPALLLYLLLIFLFFRELRLDHKRFLEHKRLANAHVLREVERFLKEKSLEKSINLIVISTCFVY